MGKLERAREARAARERWIADRFRELRRLFRQLPWSRQRSLLDTLNAQDEAPPPPRPDTRLH